MPFAEGINSAKETVMAKTRLDALLVERGYFTSRERAKAEIMSGNVFVNGVRSDKPGTQVAGDVQIEVRGGQKYVSRGGLKLEKALESFNVTPRGKVCLDCGASTGGFTDCMLQNGAVKVYAVDVGYGQLAWSLRNDARVVTMERTNARYMTGDMFDEPIEFATADVSFISLALILPAIKNVLGENGETVCLIKPQFEAGREKVGKHGVVRDKDTHIEVLENFLLNAERSGFFVSGLTWSPVRGPEGNIEYLGYLKRKSGDFTPDIRGIVEQSHTDL